MVDKIHTYANTKALKLKHFILYHTKIKLIQNYGVCQLISYDPSEKALSID